MTTWTPTHQAHAYAMGWGLFTVQIDRGRGHRQWRIQRLDDPLSVEGLLFTEPVFDCDERALQFVRENARAGCGYCIEALALHGTAVT